MEKFSKKEFIFFFIILAIGIILRLYRLDFPLGLHGDEAWTGIEARRILTQGPIGVWSPSALGQPALPFYWTALIFKVFGESIYTIRFSFIILNIFSLPFFYLSLRFLLRISVALIAFLLYVTSDIFLNFSHVAPTHALFMIPFSITLFLFFLSLKTKKTYFFLLTGFFLGLSPYFYVGLRIFPLLLLFFIFLKIFHKDFIKQYFLKLVLLFFVAFVTFVPLGLYGLEHQADFMSRTNIVSIFSSFGLQHEEKPDSFSALTNNIQKVFFMFASKGDTDPQDNYNNLPIFNYLAYFFFIVGFVTTIFSIKNEKIAFLYFWFLLFLTGSIFTVDAPNFRRIQPSIAAAYIFLALGIIWIYKVGKRYMPNSHYVLKLTLGVLLIYLAYDNVMIFYTKQAVAAETKYIFTYPLVQTASYIHTLPPPLYVYFYSTSWSFHFEPNRFLLYTLPGEDRSREFGTYSLTNSHPFENVVYIFLPDYQENLQLVQQQCPQGKSFVQRDEYGNIVFSAFYIPKQTCTRIL